MTMGMLALSASARDALTARLAELEVQRVQAAQESIPAGGSGDAADHAVNVDALIRLEKLESRIAELQLQLQAPIAETATATSVAIGSVVTVSFGPEEEPEDFLIGLVEQAAPGVEVITPSSPLGSVLLGAEPGQQVTYRAANGKTLTATLVAVAA
jgi:transcription elongation factor GreA